MYSKKGHNITKGNRDGMSRSSEFSTTKLREDLIKHFVTCSVDLVQKYVRKLYLKEIKTLINKKDSLKQCVELKISNKS